MTQYIEAFFQGLTAILPFTAHGQLVFFYMLVGIFIGFWVGILPGIGGAATLALMLPFIYKMDPTTAFAFLLGSYAVTATTGDITSILFGVPGEGITAAAVVDGHPMAKKGEAGRALGAALMSSLVGAILGAFSLAIAILLVKPLVLSMGSPEFFMLAILGITFVASLSTKNPAKGLLAGGLGLALSMIGLDPIESVPRFTFEGILPQDASLFLWDGISLVAVTIGLFAIPEIMDLAAQGTSIAREEMGKLGGVLEGVKDTFRHRWLVLRCSAIGAYIGILPAVGGGTAQWVAYAHAVQTSGDKNRFGKGAVEGVIGPGAAVNACKGGDLVTTVAFGIPSSVSTAILLGGFIIQGIVPGPDLLDPAKYLPLTFSFVWSLVVSNIITVGFCFLFLKQLAKLTNVKGAFLIPFLLLLVYLGGFTAKNSFGDMLVVLLFGALGWFMIQFDWQRPPLLLGLVLGRMAERNLFISTRAYGTAWLVRPGVLVIAVLAVGAILYSVWQMRKEKQRSAEEVANAKEKEEEDEEGSGPIVLQNRIYRPLFALFWVALFAYVLRDSWFNIRLEAERAALFPLTIAIPSLALALLVFGQELSKFIASGSSQRTPREAKSPAASNPAFSRTVAIAGWAIGFFLAIWILGFDFAVPIATFLYLKFGAKEKWVTSLVFAVAGWVFFYGLFDYTIHLPFPPGLALSWARF